MQEKIKKYAEELLQEILEKYRNKPKWDKRSLGQMVDAALKNYNEKTKKLIEDELYNILGEMYFVNNSREIAVTPVLLSDIMYKNAKDTAKTATKILADYIKSKATAKEIAMKLYEGYGFNDKEILDIADKNLPKYIRQAMFNPFKQKQAMKDIEKLKTKPLRIAYKEIFRKLDEMNGEAMYKAMQAAVEEKARYYASRIAETEVHRAAMSKRALEYLEDDEIEFVKYEMSSRHPKTDICDFYANLDLGYGKGIYPKSEMRAVPMHPFCKCVYVPVHEGAKGKQKDFNIAAKETMKQFSKKEQREILGSIQKVKEFENGKNIESIFNRLRPKYPIRKYADIFEDVKGFNNVLGDKKFGEEKMTSVKLGFDKQVDVWVNEIREEAKKIISKLKKPNTIELFKTKTAKGSYYNQSSEKIVIDNINNTYAKRVFLHEYGHHIDNMINPIKRENYKKEMEFIRARLKRPYFSLNNEFINARKEDAKLLNKKYKDVGVLKYFKEKWYNKEIYRGCSDVLDAIAGGIFKDKYHMPGHGVKYFKKEENKMTEIFAQMFRSWALNDEEWKEMKEVFPNMSKYFEDLMKGL